jgi:hypothetical protein
MNERHPTLIDVNLLDGQSKVYLFKSLKSARKYTDFLIKNRLIRWYDFLKRDTNLKQIHQFAFLPW